MAMSSYDIFGKFYDAVMAIVRERQSALADTSAMRAKAKSVLERVAAQARF